MIVRIMGSIGLIDENLRLFQQKMKKGEVRNLASGAEKFSWKAGAVAGETLSGLGLAFEICPLCCQLAFRFNGQERFNALHDQTNLVFV